MSGQCCAVARREQHRLDHPVAVRLPVVEADVAGAAVACVPAQVALEEALGIGGLRLQRGEPVLLALEPQLQLVLRCVVDRLALLDLREVLRLDRRIESLRGRRRKCCRCQQRHDARRHHPCPHDSSLPARD